MDSSIYFIIALAGFFPYFIFMITKFLRHIKITKQIASLHILTTFIAFIAFLPLFIYNIKINLWSLIGLILLVLGFITLYKASSSLKEQLIMPKGKLITAGIFNHIRNPTYLGIILLSFASFFFSLSYYIIIYSIIITFLFILIIKAEENDLILMFGKDYKNYKKKVPSLIPNFKLK